MLRFIWLSLLAVTYTRTGGQLCLAAEFTHSCQRWSVKLFLKRATQLAGVEPDVAVYTQAAKHWQ